MKRRRIYTSLLVLVLLNFTACGGGESSQENYNANSQPECVPKVISSFSTNLGYQASVNDISIYNDSLYITNSGLDFEPEFKCNGGMAIYDISNIKNPYEVFRDTNNSYRGIELGNDHLYTHVQPDHCSSAGEMTRFNIANASSPLKVSTATIYDPVFKDSLLFGIFNSSLKIFDVSDTMDIRQMGYLYLDVNRYLASSSQHKVFNNDILFTSMYNYIIAIDTYDVKHPKLIRDIKILDDPKDRRYGVSDIKIKNNILYTIGISANELIAIDISDIFNMQVISKINLNNLVSQSTVDFRINVSTGDPIVIIKNKLYIGTSSSPHVFDISDPYNIVHLYNERIDNGGEIATDGNYLFVAGGWDQDNQAMSVIDTCQ